MDIPKDGIVYANLNNALEATYRAKELVKQILTFSREREQNLAPLKIQTVISEALKLLKSTLPSTIEIVQCVNKKCGPALADPTQIHQVMMNLCTNAWHAMKEKGGILEVTMDETQIMPGDPAPYPGMGPGSYIKLAVSDTGIGMEPATAERIFEPYFTTKSKEEGTGLGLSVVHGIIRNMGGYISVYSEPGQGTTFHVYIPLIESDTVEEKNIASSSILMGCEHILLVDDEKSVVDMVRQMLERLGYRVTSRTSSLEALEVFRVKPYSFDLVLSDTTMPNMTGIALSEELIRIRKDIPIIICSGFSETINEERAKTAGVRKYIMKPVIMRDLAEAVRRTLDDHTK